MRWGAWGSTETSIAKAIPADFDRMVKATSFGSDLSMEARS
jgi:hypothetical protein